VELNDRPPPEGEGIQITLFDDEYSIAVPYWHQGVKARDVFKRVWDYLNIMQAETGFPIYDGQFGRTLDLTKDFDQVVSFYADSVQRTRSVVANSHKRRPWWKFW